jgi:arylsulfatase A-like enzyme
MYDAITHIPLIIRDGRGGKLRRAGESVQDLVSLIDLGPTLLQAAGVDVPTYLEGTSLLPYLEAPEQAVARDFVYAEDNYQIMMRSQTHKLVYYIGQECGEFYDLRDDPHELRNLWDAPATRDHRQKHTERLLAWLATSTYYNAGYRRDRSRSYRMRWPTPDDAYLHGRMSVGGPRQLPL